MAKPVTFTVTTTATQISTGAPGNSVRRIKNLGAATIFLGAADVTTSGANKGYDLAAGAEFIDTCPADALWAIIGAATAEVRVWEVTR